MARSFTIAPDGRWLVADALHVAQWELDFAQALGYTEDTLDRLIRHPFDFDGEQVVATEVVLDADGNSIPDGGDGVLLNRVHYPLPEGWSVAHGSFIPPQR